MLHCVCCAALFPRTIQSRGSWPLLLVLPQMIQSEASGRHLSLDDPVQGVVAPAACSDLEHPVWGVNLISPDVAVVLFWPLVLVSPRMIQSRPLHGLITASLHHHGLLWVSASLVHHGLLLLAAAPHLLSPVQLSASLHPQGLVLIIVSVHLLGLVLITASLHHHSLVLMAASLPHCGLIHRTASLLHHGPVLIIAALHLLSLVLITVSLHLPGVVLCVASRLPSIAALPRPLPSVSFASGCHFPPDAPVLGWGFLLLDPPQTILPGASATFCRMILS